MARLGDILFGLSILDRLDTEKVGQVVAEHDAIYAGWLSMPSPTEEEMEAMKDAGWRYDSPTDSWYHWM